MRFSFALAFLALPAAAQLTLPEPSPKAEVRQVVGFTDVGLTYFRPSAKGRAIFGALVPYGKLWRTGAADATTFTVSDSVKIDGKWLPKGSYSLFTIPEKTTWTVIFNRQVGGHGTDGYEAASDVLRVRVPADSTAEFRESFTIELGDVSRSTARVALRWANTQASFLLESTADARVAADLRRLTPPGQPVKPALYYQAAQYYAEGNRDHQQALAWIDQAIALKPSLQYYHLRAKIQAGLGNYPAAIVAAQKSAEMARKEGADDFAALNDRLVAEWQKKK